MIVSAPSQHREHKSVDLQCDLAIVGGGVAGVCGAITAARAGLKVVLVQDRPVLGGNASAEVRLWILGATSHMGNNNRWAREGGVIDEILVENLYRNPEGNPVLVDALLLDKVVAEKNITLLLNTAVFEVDKSGGDAIRSVRAFCSQNSTMYRIAAPLFCDASGDGVVGFLAGAAFRMGAEAASEFDEKFAPAKEYGELLGHSLYFYSKDAGRPVTFVPPAFALTDITAIPRFRNFSTREHGCRLWWIEYGGRLDTVHDTETIKWELWKVVYCVWNHIKNSGAFPDAANLTLEWVGQIPGKRESRRFEGDHILTQRDIIERRGHPDDVAFGGWSIDLHPADGIYSPASGCNQWHAKGIYPIPLRCMYSRNIPNLFLAGRIISASHVAFASSRVMATCAHGAQAVGMAAAICRERRWTPRQLAEPDRVGELQQRLLAIGQHIPNLRLDDPTDPARSARLVASSELALSSLPDCGQTMSLEHSSAMMLPTPAGPMPKVTFTLDIARATTLRAELRLAERPDEHTPETVVATREIALAAGAGQAINIDFAATIPEARYAFVILHANADVSAHLSDHRVSGILALHHRVATAAGGAMTQDPQGDIGVDRFEFWCPRRRPDGKNLAIELDPPLKGFGPGNVVNGLARPTRAANAWVADFADENPTLELKWDEPQQIGRIELAFDPDFDHPMESVLMGHPERVMPFCVPSVRILDARGVEIARRDENHQARVTIRLDRPIVTDAITVELHRPSARVPAALFEVRCHAG